MAKSKRVKKTTRTSKVTHKKTWIEYNSFTFLIFLVFVLVVTLLLVSRMLATN